MEESNLKKEKKSVLAVSTFFLRTLFWQGVRMTKVGC